MPTTPTDNDALLAQVVQANRRLSAWVKVMFGVWAVTLVGGGWIVETSQAHASGASQILRVRELQIVDAAGKTRVRIAAPLPEPIVNGKTAKREDGVSGVMIYDALGNERGGYVTDNSVGNAFLTLDSNTGQEVTLVAYPHGGAEFGMNDDKTNKIALQAMETGPRLRLVQAGATLTDLPARSSGH
jgi:hypothetical protein